MVCFLQQDRGDAAEVAGTGRRIATGLCSAAHVFTVYMDRYYSRYPRQRKARDGFFQTLFTAA